VRSVLTCGGSSTHGPCQTAPKSAARSVDQRNHPRLRTATDTGNRREVPTPRVLSTASEAWSAAVDERFGTREVESSLR
jgi:hypothetical protein